MKRNRIFFTVIRVVVMAAVLALVLAVLALAVIHSATTLFWMGILALAVLGIAAISAQMKLDEKETREV